MNHDNPFFMNFNVSDFMSKFANSGMDNEYSKKLMEAHQKNLDTFVNANKVVTDGYKAIANKQMEIFQEGLTKMASYSPEQAAEYTQTTFKESTEQMQQLLEMATKAHQDAFNILSARAKDLMSEAKG
jgi:hypothetical protein